MRTIQLTEQTKQDLLNSLLKRSPGNYAEYEAAVAEIIDKVREEGDAALFSYTKKFDKWEINEENIRVTEAEIEEERRMFYVAMTRAKHSLCLMAAKGKTGKDAPSRFLACLTEHF